MKQEARPGAAKAAKAGAIAAGGPAAGMMAVIAAIGVAGLAGCWQSTDLGSWRDANGDDGTVDGTVDTATDTAPDTVWDPLYDTLVDTALDPSWDTWIDTIEDPWYDLPDGTGVCEPSSDASTWFEVTGGTWYPDETILDRNCRVEGVLEEEWGHYVIRLACWSASGMIEEIQVSLWMNPPSWPGIWEGMQVRLRYSVQDTWWQNRHLAISYEGGGLVLAAVSAGSLAPWGADEAEWYAPVRVSWVDTACTPEPDSCGPVARLALRVGYGGDERDIFDRNWGWVGMMMSVNVIVGNATRHIDMECDDAPDIFFDALFIAVPEG